MKNNDPQIEAMLQSRERLEHLRIIANQPEYKYYLQPKMILFILAVIIGGIIVWFIAPSIASNKTIPLLGYVIIAQVLFLRSENIRLKKQQDATREMNALEKTMEANQGMDLTR